MNASGSQPASANPQHWSQIKEAGTLTGMRLIYLLYRLFGRRFFSLLMYPVALYFVISKPTQRRASRQFLTAHYKQAPHKWRRPPNNLHVLLHFKAFAEVILDKLLGWLIKIDKSDFVLTSPQTVEALLDDTRGQLIIGSHFGNLEFCRGFMHRYKNKVINILLYDKHAGNFVKMMQKQNDESRLNVFQVDEFDMNTILKLKEKIDAGEWVFIAGDRIPLSGVERTVDVKFLGKTAPLPIGPYMLAKALACPVNYMFAYRYRPVGNKVVFDVTPVCDKLVVSRKNRAVDIQQHAQQFADKLEEHCLQAPYQWFNFYNFWQPDEDSRAHISDSKEGL
ncbi:acyltransferase [Alteromonas ponticola]|uniref:Acyltransferase n=1 Tax=Alteromonas ponticola TaxID=2720613 RepID=A0ABX1R590_9ALTE|nr:acyltransferase [Alteromonas ponticola]NMH60666.1 acyltransferase [Alteromonas ponticola]